jgi:SAM-dependent methyltransferase
MDVRELEAFYATGLGTVAGELLAQKLRAFWPDVRGQRLLGFGYCRPLLHAFSTEAERVAAFMPARQGVVPWPGERGNRVALAEETRLPVPDAMFDRVVLAHTLESSEERRALMREIWRVMTPEGRLILMVPNRTGLWARFEGTPFGWGQPYSRGQVKRLLGENMFSPLSWRTALYAPPIDSRFGIRLLRATERVGDGWLPRFAGILMVEAEKRTAAQPIFKEQAAPAGVPAGVVEGLKDRRWF